MADRNIKQITSFLGRRFAVLAGAGISYPAPASVPTASAIAKAIISSLPVPQEDKDELLAATDPRWTRGLGFFDFLRFEQLLSRCAISLDPDLETTVAVFEGSRPNSYHYQLASLIHKGHLVFTTNIDCLIEDACEDLGFRCHVLVRDDQYEAFSRNPSEFPFPLFKLHGSVMSRGGHPSIFIEEVTGELRENASKWAVARKLFGDRNILVIGYSGSDDFDVMPTLAATMKRSRLVWIHHAETVDLQVYPLSASHDGPIVPPKLAWFFGRMFGSLRALSHVARLPDDILLVVGRTSTVLDALTGKAHPGSSNEVTANALQPKMSSADLEAVLAKKARARKAAAFLLAGFLFCDVGLFEKSARFLTSARKKSRSWFRSESVEFSLELELCQAEIDIARERVGSFLGALDKVSRLLGALRHRPAKYHRRPEAYLHALLRLNREANRVRLVDKLRPGPSRYSEDELATIEQKCEQLWRDWWPFVSQFPIPSGEQAWRDRQTELWTVEKAMMSRPLKIRAIVSSLEGLKSLETTTGYAPLFLLEAGDAAFYQEEFYALMLHKELSDDFLMRLSDCYELIVDRPRLAFVELVHASTYLSGGYADWADEKACVALSIYHKIGNIRGVMAALFLLEHSRRLQGQKEEAADCQAFQDRLLTLLSADADAFKVRRLLDATMERFVPLLWDFQKSGQPADDVPLLIKLPAWRDLLRPKKD